MKRIIIPLALGALMLAVSGSGMAANVTMHTAANFNILSMSPNGKWACGVFIDASMNTTAFRWNLEGGSIEILNNGYTAWDVANDGTVSGDFGDRSVMPNGAPVSMPGYWRDGQWHALEKPDGNITDGMGAGISPDGRFMTGSIEVNGQYTPFIWENGKLSRNLDTGNQAVAYAVSPDGTMAAGFSTQRNRTNCIWMPDGTVTFVEDTEEYSQNPWCYMRNFSPDGSKIVYWGGWELNDDETELYLYALCDLKSGEHIKVKAPSVQSDLEFYDVSNSGMLVGSDNGRGIIYNGTEGAYIDDYLASRGVDLSSFNDFYKGGDYYTDTMPIFRVVAVSEDENTLAMQYYNTDGSECGMVLKIDCDASKMPPAELAVSQLEGLDIVGLTWKAPAGSTGIRGYNIYRNNKKINGLLPVNALSYYDKKLAPGNYEYVVATVNAAGQETKGEPVVVTVSNETPWRAPLNVLARQKGVDGILMNWREPQSNKVHKYHHDLEADAHSGAFSVYQAVDLEAAVKFDKAEMENYAGYQISEVSFWPLADHYAWSVNIYTRSQNGEPELIGSQPITQTLVYGQSNTVVLDEPIDVPQGDLYVAIEVEVNPGYSTVLGAQDSKVKPGYSDLLRLVDEPEFFSIWDSSLEGALTLTTLSWMIDLGLSKADYDNDANSVKTYNLYLDGNHKSSQLGKTWVLDKVAEGRHTLGVEAVYNSGKVSSRVETEIEIAASYPCVEEPEIIRDATDDTLLTLSWEAPKDSDRHRVAYVGGEDATHGVQGSTSNNYGMMARVDFPPSMLRSYNGYLIESFSFYPMANAIFTFILYEDDEYRCEVEVEDYRLNQWNSVKLPYAVHVNENATYRLVLDCFNPEPEKQLLGVDNYPSFGYASDLFSQDNGATWGALSEESIRGNWMLGMDILDERGVEMAVEGYDVVIDNSKHNSEPVTATEYSCQVELSRKEQHPVRIDTYYPSRSESVEGKTVYFFLAQSGLDEAVGTAITLKQGESWLQANGDGVEAMEIISASGVKVATANGDRVDISDLAEGIYIVNVKAGEKTIAHKILIRK